MVHPVKESNKVRVSFGYMERYPNTAFFRNIGLANKPHKGIDYAPRTEYRSEEFVIVSPVDGKVMRAGFAPDYGYHIRIEDSEGNCHILAHLKTQPIVHVNTVVLEGEDIGWMGNTGNSTARHLHYEVRNTCVLPPPHNCRLDPERWTT